MAGIRGRSGPPGNQNAFRYDLASISQRRGNGAITPDEQTIREDILAGLVADKSGEAQISTATHVLAEIITYFMRSGLNCALTKLCKVAARQESRPRIKTQ